MALFAVPTMLCAVSGAGCDRIRQLLPRMSTEGSLPTDAIKVTPEQDVFPPILHSGEFEEPVPLPGPVNTAGAEDSPFVLPDGNTLCFFFTPDVRVLVNSRSATG